MAWTGPLGVLIDRQLASASEIFAAAIQDYSRGIIIGETSFGKGTMQTIFDLDRAADNDKREYGLLKITVGQFFRITGPSTQLHGVTDISLSNLSESATNEAMLCNQCHADQSLFASPIQTNRAWQGLDEARVHGERLSDNGTVERNGTGADWTEKSPACKLQVKPAITGHQDIWLNEAAHILADEFKLPERDLQAAKIAN